MRNLHLTTPHMRGKDVREVQSWLVHNRWGKQFLEQHDIDGEFGPKTARAVHHAKWWLGYSRPNNHVGRFFLSFLKPRAAGGVNLTTPMKVRKRHRLHPVKETRRQKALKTAMSQVGYSPGDCSKYGQWYGIPCGEWCAMFASWCYHQAGSRFHYAYCPFIVHDAKYGLNGLVQTFHPEGGDLALFDWDNDRIADHVGIVRYLDGSMVHTVEGNTGEVDWSRGGQVLLRERPSSLVICYARVAS